MNSGCALIEIHAAKDGKVRDKWSSYCDCRLQ
jgi:hypothetical protein